MSDLKEETTVDNNELDQNTEETAEESPSPRVIDPNLQGIELFFAKNKKMITYAGVGIVVIVAAFVYYKFSYLPEKEDEASNEIFWAQSFFERDSFNIAVNGGPQVLSPDGQKSMMGFDQIAEDYSMTKTGNLANFYAGICYLRTGKYDQAIERLQKFNGNDAVIAPIALGATGDCYMEKNQLDEAITYYLKAAEKDENTFTTPLYLKKAGFAYEQKANYAEALNVYERIRKEYGQSEVGREIKRDIAKVKALGNL